MRHAWPVVREALPDTHGASLLQYLVTGAAAHTRGLLGKQHGTPRRDAPCAMQCSAHPGCTLSEACWGCWQVRKRRSKTQGLSEQLRHLAQVLEAYEEGVALFEASEPSWHILFVNEALLSLTGALLPALQCFLANPAAQSAFPSWLQCD